MYPFSTCSSMNSSSAVSSVLVMGYILQSMMSGTPFLKSMAWSQLRFGGNLFASSSLNAFAKRWYSCGMLTSLTYYLASIASSTADHRPCTCSSRVVTICSFVSVVNIRDTLSSPSSSFSSRASTALLSFGLTDHSTMGSCFSSIVA